MSEAVFSQEAVGETRAWLEHIHAQLEKKPARELFARLNRDLTVRGGHMIFSAAAESAEHANLIHCKQVFKEAALLGPVQHQQPSYLLLDAARRAHTLPPPALHRTSSLLHGRHSATCATGFG